MFVPILRLVGLCLLGCMDGGRSLMPRVRSIEAALGVGGRSTLTGCAAFKIQIDTMHGTVTVDSVTVSGCGGMIRPVLDSTSSYKKSTRTVTLILAAKNTDSVGITAPTRLDGWRDSVSIISPTGLNNHGTTCGTQSGQCVTFSNADTTLTGNGSEWRFDTLLAAHGLPQVLVGGGKSRHRAVQMTVKSNVLSFQITLRVKALEGAAVPALPPTSQPAWVLSDSNYAPPATGLPLGFARNVIHIIFKVGTSQAQRQQAVDQVGGVVVGGIPLTGGDGYYDVAIPDSGQGVQLQAAVTSLRSLSQVDGASVIVRSTTPYLRPHDGAGWQAWHSTPTARVASRIGHSSMLGPR